MGSHFQPGDLVFIHLRKERFLRKSKSKLLPRLGGPFEILERVGPNTYIIDLPKDYWVFATFYFDDLSPYFDEEEDLIRLKANSFEKGGIMGIKASVPSMSCRKNYQPH